MAIHWFADGPAESSRLGGKGASLLQMQQAGLPVPPGFCISAESYQDFHDAAGLEPLVASLAGAPGLDTAAGARFATTGIVERLGTIALHDDLQEEIATAYRELCGRDADERLVAVRSSAIGEDGAGSSFAGIYDSFLHRRGAAAICDSVLDCYRALWHPRAVQYRATRGMDQRSEAMAVVVMTMIHAEVSGVAFSANPVTGDTGEILVNAAWGLGEAVVSGQVTPDNVLMSKDDGAVLHYEIGDKSLEIMLDEGAGGGTAARAVSAERAGAPCLDDADLTAIHDLACRAESHYGTPQDIEFARADGRWFLLQSRPITGLG